MRRPSSRQVSRAVALVALVLGLLVQFGSLAIHSLTSLWLLGIAVAMLAHGLCLYGAVVGGDNNSTASARGVAFLTAAVLNVALQHSAYESATGGLNTGVRDGEYVLLNHGKISRRLSADQYRRAFQTERALFASVGVLFSVFALVVEWRREARKAEE